MAKNKNYKEYEALVKHDFRKIDPKDVRVIDIDIIDAGNEYNKIYVANTNILRQCSWVGSGLKVGETRLIYAMYKMGAIKTLFKGADVSGRVMGEFHPHGNSSIDGTFVRLAQPWKCNHPLVRIDGNAGSIQGDGAAATRYIEGMLSECAYDCFFEDFDKTVVDMKPTYTNKSEEPEFVLPAKIPYILLNDVFGIGKGAQCSVYGTNLIELVDVTKKLMNDPEADVVLYPDESTGADVIDEGQFKEIFNGGKEGFSKGKYKTRARIDIETDSKGRTMLVIRSITMFYDLYKIIDSITTMMKENKLPEIYDLNNHSNDTEIEFHLVLKPGADPYKLREKLYSHTGLQDTQNVSCIFIDNYEDKKFSYRSAILTWLDYRRDYKRRLTISEIVKNHERLHKLYVLIYVTEGANAEKTVKIIKDSVSKEDAIEKIMKAYNITSLQAKEIVEMNVYKLTKAFNAAYKKEEKEIEKILPKLEKRAKYMSEIDKEIISEMETMAKKYGRPRKSRILRIEDYQSVMESSHTIVISKNGLIKKLSDKIDKVGNLPEGDYPIEVYRCDNSDSLLLFDSQGVCTKVLVSDIPGCGMNDFGTDLKSIYPGIKGHIVSIKQYGGKKISKKVANSHILFLTKKGLAKKTTLDNYLSSTKSLTAIQIRQGDELVSVKIMDKNKDLIVYTSDGYGIRLNSKDIKEAGRNTIGSKCITLDNGYLIGADIINSSDKGIFCMTDKGNAKMCELAKFPVDDKKKSPFRLISLNDNEIIKKIKTVECDEVAKVILKSQVISLELKEMNFAPRLAKGRKTVPVKRGDMIIDIIME